MTSLIEHLVDGGRSWRRTNRGDYVAEDGSARINVGIGYAILIRPSGFSRTFTRAEAAARFLEENP